MSWPVAAAPGWLREQDVKRQLRIDGSDTEDDDLIAGCSLAAEVEVIRARPDAAAAPASFPDVYLGAIMLAARLLRRRNSPAGVESFSDSVVYVAAYDPDLDRFLRRGRYRLPGVG